MLKIISMITDKAEMNSLLLKCKQKLIHKETTTTFRPYLQNENLNLILAIQMYKPMTRSIPFMIHSIKSFLSHASINKTVNQTLNDEVCRLYHDSLYF